jgi:hypothetical protein
VSLEYVILFFPVVKPQIIESDQNKIITEEGTKRCTVHKLMKLGIELDLKLFLSVNLLPSV